MALVAVALSVLHAPAPSASAESASAEPAAIEQPEAVPAVVEPEPVQPLAATAAEPASVEPVSAEPVASATAEPAPESGAAASIEGSITSTGTFTGGDANDRLSTRLALQWSAGRWTGGLAAEVENAQQDGAIWSEPGVGSFDLPERWIAWTSRGPRAVQARLGSAYGLRFAEGLVLGAASFDGVQLSMDPTPRLRLVALAGRTEALDPEDLLDEPIGLFPEDDPDLGDDGELAGLRLELRPADQLVLGTSLLAARTDGAPRADLAGVDLAWSRGMVDVAAEVAAREGGGSAAYVRADVTPDSEWGFGVEARRYRQFRSPLGSAPLYGGLTAGDEHDETGALVRADFAPWRRFSGSVSWDYSEGPDKSSGTGGDGTLVRRDARLALRWTVAERTTVAYGFEHEDVSHGRDGSVHSLLTTTAFEKAGRLAVRLSWDAATEDTRRSARVSYRLPLLGRKLTILVDDTYRFEDGGRNRLQAGASIRIGRASFLTVRGTLAQREDDSVDVTWYRRF